MKRTLAIALCAAVGSAASAGPGRPGVVKPIPGPYSPGAGVDSHDSLNDNFDCYAVGDGIGSQPGWELWPGGNDGVITDEFAASGSNSLHLPVTNTDVVRQFDDFDGGQVVFSIMTYIRSDSDITGAIIALNQYDGGGTGTNWSIQVRFDSLLGTLESQFSGITTPIIYDEWVELRSEIDLDADTVDIFYDGVQWVDDQSWVDGVSTGGIPVFQAIDLWIENAFTPFGIYLDDVLVTRPGCSPDSTCGGGDPGDCGGGCYADCDESGGLDFFDFLCFQSAFAAGEAYADCDGSGGHDFFDFLCFQGEFAAGCP